MALVTGPADPRLDLDPWVGQRQATWRFDLTDAATGASLGELHPVRAGSLDHDTTRTIKRTLTLDLHVTDAAAVNPLTDRLTVSMLVAGQTWPLGRYMWTNDTATTSTGGDRSANQLVDEMFVVDQQIEKGFAPTGNADAAVLDLLAGLPLVGVSVEATPYLAVGGWGSGTRRGQILDALATQGDYQTPWIDHNGIFQMVRTVDPDTAVPAMDLDAGNRVHRDSITRTSDILDAPNRFVVISNDGAAAAAPIVGSFDVPATAPHSIAQRGFVIPDVVTVQLATQAQATAAARNLGLRQTIVERVELATAPDPRHDGYDVVVWQGAHWLEAAWSLDLAEGGRMRHILLRKFA